MRRFLALAAALACLTAGCTGEREPATGAASPGASATSAGSPEGGASPTAEATTTPSPGEASSPVASPTASPTAASSPGRPARFEVTRAMATVRLLAGRIGPREATSPAFHRAARHVQRRLRALGFDVSTQRVRAPAGVSWGVPVDAGRSLNVVARPDGFRPDRPHLVVGAHLDTVPQAPGAEDNASGVAVLLELARLVSLEGSRLPVVLVAFGAEEPRGEGDALHHFGSRAYVQRMSRAERRTLRGMVSLDRVGVGSVVPLCTGGLSPLTVRAQLVRAAESLGVPVQTCADNASSDHWQFEQAGEAAARIGSTPYAAYHSAADRPPVVDPAQLRRVGRVAWEWLTR